MSVQELSALPFRELVALSDRQKKTKDLAWGDDFRSRILHRYLRPALIEQLSRKEATNGADHHA